MSFVIAEPGLVQAAASQLAGIRSALAEVAAAAAAHTTGLAPAAADEVSAAIAALFGTFGEEYQAANAQAAMFHAEFVNLLNAGASAYANAEAAGRAALAQNIKAVATGEGTAAAASAESIGLGAQLEAQLNALAASFGINLPALNAQVNASLSTNFGPGLPALGGAFTGGLNGFLGAGQNFGANLANSLGGGFNGLIQTGQTVAGNLAGAFSVPTLAAQLSGALSAGFGNGSPGLVAALNGGLNGFANASQTLGANLAKGLGGDFNGLIQTGQAFAGNLAGAFSAPTLAAQLSGALSGGLGNGFSGLIQTGQTFAGNLAGALGNPSLATQLGGALQGSFGADLPNLTANLNAQMSELQARFNGALNGALNGDFTGAAGLPTGVVDQLGQAQADMFTGLVNREVAFNQSLVANEMALQKAFFGTDTAFNGAINSGFNTANVVLGTGEQAVNVLLGAPMPQSFTGSLIVGGSGQGSVPTGGLLGAMQQALGVNAALGGPPVDASFLSQLQLSGANLVNDQLAFNQAAVANVLGLQQSLFGTTSAFNGVINNAFNMVSSVVVTGQHGFDALLGIPVPPGFDTSLMANGSGDVFGGVQTAGLLGAIEQKFLMDGAFLSNFGFPFQAALTGGVNGGVTGQTGG